MINFQVEPPSGSPTKWCLNKDYSRIDGSVSAGKRQEIADTFNMQDSTVKLLIGSVKAAGLGLNMIGANRVIMFDLMDNPTHEVQGVCRAYRYGQQKQVCVYRLVSAKSMEEKVYVNQCSKITMFRRTVDEDNMNRIFKNDKALHTGLRNPTGDDLGDDDDDDDDDYDGSSDSEDEDGMSQDSDRDYAGPKSKQDRQREKAAETAANIDYIKNDPNTAPKDRVLQDVLRSTVGLKRIKKYHMHNSVFSTGEDNELTEEEKKGAVQAVDADYLAAGTANAASRVTGPPKRNIAAISPNGAAGFSLNAGVHPAGISAARAPASSSKDRLQAAISPPHNGTAVQRTLRKDLKVTFNKVLSQYKAEICDNGGRQYLGMFKTPEAAHDYYDMLFADHPAKAPTNPNVTAPTRPATTAPNPPSVPGLSAPGAPKIASVPREPTRALQAASTNRLDNATHGADRDRDGHDGNCSLVKEWQATKAVARGVATGVAAPAMAMDPIVLQVPQVNSVSQVAATMDSIASIKANSSSVPLSMPGLSGSGAPTLPSVPREQTVTSKTEIQSRLLSSMLGHVESTKTWNGKSGSSPNTLDNTKQAKISSVASKKINFTPKRKQELIAADQKRRKAAAAAPNSANQNAKQGLSALNKVFFAPSNQAKQGHPSQDMSADDGEPLPRGAAESLLGLKNASLSNLRVVVGTRVFPLADHQATAAHLWQRGENSSMLVEEEDRLYYIDMEDKRAQLIATETAPSPPSTPNQGAGTAGVSPYFGGPKSAEPIRLGGKRKERRQAPNGTPGNAEAKRPRINAPVVAESTLAGSPTPGSVGSASQSLTLFGNPTPGSVGSESAPIEIDDD